MHAIADIGPNGNGEQTNYLATGDRLNGLGGTDTLRAWVQEASALNEGPGAAIAPITEIRCCQISEGMVCFTMPWVA